MEATRRVTEKRSALQENFLERIYTPDVIQYIEQCDVQALRLYAVGRLLVPLAFSAEEKASRPGYKHPAEVSYAAETYRNVIKITPFFTDLSYLVERAWNKKIPSVVTKHIAVMALELAFWHVGATEERFAYYVHRIKLLEIVSALNTTIASALQPLNTHPQTWNWNGVTATQILRHEGDFGFTEREKLLIRALVVYGSVADCAQCADIGNVNTATTLARSIRLKIESGGRETPEGVSWKAKREGILQFLMTYTPLDDRESQIAGVLIGAEGNVTHAAHILQMNTGTIYNFLKKAGYTKIPQVKPSRKRKR